MISGVRDHALALASILAYGGWSVERAGVTIKVDRDRLNASLAPPER